MGNQASKIMDKAKDRSTDRKSRHPSRALSVKSSSAASTSEQPSLSIILDIGTGHGDWAYEVASTYPKSKIIALDLNPPHAPATILNNLVFKHIDITQRWDIEDNSVDFVFQRDMNRVLLKSNWDHILREMYRVTQPGGVLEILESEFFHHNAGPVQAHADEFFKAQCEHIGRDCDLADHLAADLINVGFINVEQKSLDIPVGEWPSDPNLKQIGFNNFELQRSKLKSLRSAYVEDMGLSGDDYDAASKLILAEFEEYQGYTKWVCWTAEKPS
ncbi:S-adenosyl-L-methionine-dependent methyltransferase [Umbelopsis sp. AD052]|nr:S-adenosyl-L-methionine-dependent methyltransferase [Umbelopsis sp. AD052]